MLYFKFNTDNFVAPKTECLVTECKNGKPISSPEKEIYTVDLSQIQDFFFQKLHKELNLPEIKIGDVFWKVIEIPTTAFGIDDEAIKFVLFKYEKLPIKELNNKSLNDLGISIEFCKRCSNEERNSKIKTFMQKNNLEYATEEVLWKNMTTNQRADKFSQYLAEIGSNGNELIIVDPYIFSSKEDNYCELLASILELSAAKTIIVITDKKNYKIKCKEKISNKITKPLDIRYSNDFHDRFWIANRKNGFYTGTSFNGIGKKISLINMLSEDDVKCIIDELYQQSLIS